MKRQQHNEHFPQGSNMTNTDKRAQLIALLKDKSVRWGTFTLASGKTSDFYVDARVTTLHAQGALLIADLVLEALNDEVVAVGGPVTGAIPIVGAVALRSAQLNRSVHGFMVRKQAKGHGAQNWVEGLANLPENAAVCMVEDTVTTAGSLVTAIEKVQALGYRVVQAIAVVDREEGARQRLEAAGVPFIALTTRSDLQD